MHDIQKLRMALGIDGGSPSTVIGLAIKHIKEQEREIERLNVLIETQDRYEQMRDEE